MNAQKIEAAPAKYLTVTLTVDQTPEEAFAAINDVRGWWSGEFDGTTDKLGSEFTYRYKAIHYSKQKITEMVPGKKVTWVVVDSTLSFIEDKTEWTGTKMTFEIARKGGKTEVRFTHVGLAPRNECFTACSDAWGSLIKVNLKALIASKGSNEKRMAKPRRLSASTRSAR